MSEVKVTTAKRERRWARVEDPSTLVPSLTLGHLRRLVDEATALEIPDNTEVRLTRVTQSTVDAPGTYYAGAALLDFTGTWVTPLDADGGDS
ncbi:hypothetical protein ACIOWF_06855 [Cellulosimicrobium cellulans]|uniref:hypothetical protein n=1 Tax=Cellulosimicrobium cellulans TaxID=1710 RepID=UPI00382DB126